MLVENEKAVFRVVAIGDSAVGKTCIINRFMRDTFEPKEANTIGALYDSFIQDYQGRAIEIQLWDTAGQEQYRALGPVYFRSAAAALVVFDVTNEQSFKSVEDWVKTFRSVSNDDPTIIIIGNKCDITARVVCVKEAKDWAHSQGFTYVETSAKTGQGVIGLFNELVASVAKGGIGTFDKTQLTANPAGGGCC